MRKITKDERDEARALAEALKLDNGCHACASYELADHTLRLIEELEKVYAENQRLRDALRGAEEIDAWTHAAFKRMLIPTKVLRAIEKQKQVLEEVEKDE
jgi:alcohol dehydrogenase class IV